MWLVAQIPPANTELLPLFPLSTVLVPKMPLALHVFEPRYRQLVADLLSEDVPGAPIFGVVALRHGLEVGRLADVHEIGTTARVSDVLPRGDGGCDLAAVGERRFTIHSVDNASRPYLLASVSYLPEDDGELRPGNLAATRRAWHKHLLILAALPGVSVATIGTPTDAGELSYAVAQLGTLPLADRQLLLTAKDTAQRLERARSILRRESELIRQLHAIPAGATALRYGRQSG